MTNGNDAQPSFTDRVKDALAAITGSLPTSPTPPPVDPLLSDEFEFAWGAHPPAQELSSEGPQQPAELIPGPEEEGDYDMAGRPPHGRLFELGINGQSYLSSGWQTAESAQRLERRYDKGGVGGVGIFSEGVQDAPGQLYAAVNVDVSTYPYIRLLPLRTSTALANVTGAKPTYMFVVEDSGAAEYVYILNGRYAKKVKLSDNTLQSTKDFGVNAVCGRPVLFEGKYRIPLGDAVDATTLTTVAVGAAADTYTALTGIKALHFGIGMQEGIAQIIRAHATNLISISASADAPSFGDTFEVGDSSLAISDILSIGGEQIICKPDAPWKFSLDGGGNAYSIMEFVGKAEYLSGYTGADGANSGAFGPYAYWTHSSALWLLFGDSATPVDPMSNRLFSGLDLQTTDATGLVPSYFGRWLSFAAYGRWAYATEATSGLWQGYVENDGSITWLGNIFSAQGTSLQALNRCFIVNSSSAPILYILDSQAVLFRIDLQEDGSLRKVTASGTDHGGDDELSLVVAPETNFGEPEKQKQVRGMWVETDDFPASGFVVRTTIYRDRSKTPTQIGSDISTGGKQTTATTPGTSDTFNSILPALELDTGTFAEATEDPRIRAWGIWAVTPTVYKIAIPYDEAMIGQHPQMVQKLRDLKGGKGVTFHTPGFGADFTGYIVDVQETAVIHGLTRRNDIILTVQRWVL